MSAMARKTKGGGEGNAWHTFVPDVGSVDGVAQLLAVVAPDNPVILALVFGDVVIGGAGTGLVKAFGGAEDAV